MAKYIKNNTNSSKAWCGQEILAGQYYLLEKQEENRWSNDSDVLTSITNEEIVVSSTNDSGGHIDDYASAVNYLKDDVIEIDSQGRQVTRIAAASKGWTYLAHFYEFETSKSGSLECKDWQGNNDTSLSIKFFDTNGNEITTAGNYGSLQLRLDAECVKTEVLFKPNYDFELIGGTIRVITTPTTDCRIWVIGGVMELGAAGVKEFVKNMNLKFLGVDESLNTDGRASKFMAKTTAGIPYQTNQIKLIIKHTAGSKHQLMMDLEYFRS